MGKIFYIMGKSSAGKDSIYRELQEHLPGLRTITLYTTRPRRVGEENGKDYYFVEEARLQELTEAGKVIELRAYDTKCGIWKYFTADDGQIDLKKADYLAIGTLCSYEKMRQYFGEEMLVPIYVEIEDGERLQRALNRERKQEHPQYAEMCRRFLADSTDFSEENIERAGVKKRFKNENLAECVQEILQYLEAER